jgi:hypothetical protein
LFCAPGLVFGSVGSVSSLFHVLCSMTRFRQYRGPPVFMFCTPGLVFGGTERVGSRFLIFRGTEGVPSRFHVFCSSTHFRWYRRHQVPFSRYVLSDSFSAIPGASGPIFLFCAPGLIFDGTEGVESLFHVFGSRTYFRRYRGRQVPFSCSALPDYFSVVSRASGLVFMFCAPILVFGGTEGVGSHFHILRARTSVRRYQGHQIPFSCFALLDSFSTVPCASGPIFMICAPGLVFGGT